MSTEQKNKEALAEARREYWQALKIRLRAKNLADLAKILEITPTQIYNISRVDRHANQKLLERLAHLAPDLDPSCFAKPEDGSQEAKDLKKPNILTITLLIEIGEKARNEIISALILDAEKHGKLLQITIS